MEIQLSVQIHIVQLKNTHKTTYFQLNGKGLEMEKND